MTKHLQSSIEGAATSLRGEVLNFCPVPHSAYVVEGAADVRSALLSEAFTSVRDVTPGDWFLDTGLDIETRSASFFTNWPMFCEGERHVSLRKAARLLGDGSPEAPAEHMQVFVQGLLQALPLGPFDWKSTVSVPVSEFVVERIFRTPMPQAKSCELIALGRTIMLELSGRAPGVKTRGAAVAAASRLHELVTQDEAALREAVGGVVTDSPGLTGVVAQVLTGSLDPLEAVLDAIPVFKETASGSDDIVSRTVPFRFAKRLARDDAPRDTPSAAYMRLDSDDPKEALPFGWGKHRCVGARLTESSVTAVLTAMDSLTPHRIQFLEGSLEPGAILHFSSMKVVCQ